MSDFIAGALADVAALLPSFLLDTCTNSRTNVTTICRVRDTTREDRLGEMRDLMRLLHWALIFQDTVDVAVGDIISVVGKGSFIIVMKQDPATLTACIHTGAIALPSPITATTKRQAGALSPGQTRSDTTNLTLTIYPFLGLVMHPVAPAEVTDILGVGVQQMNSVYIASPVAVDPNPIRVKDILVIPSGIWAGSYTVFGVKPYTPGITQVYVDVTG